MSKPMTIADYYRWFHREWMRAGLVVAVFLLVYLTVLVAPVNLVLYAMLLCAPLYMLHETEEYIFPGGFAQFANRDIYKQDPENGLADETAVFWINMGYIWLALPVCGLLAVYDLRFAAWMPYFFIFQALVHVMLSIVARRRYLIYTADGYMSAEIMDPDRQQSDPNFPLETASARTLSDSDRARAYSTYLSYCGTYSVEGEIVTHHVKAELIPSWTGSDQTRHFKFDHGCLIIGQGNQKLTWERAVKHA